MTQCDMTQCDMAQCESFQLISSGDLLQKEFIEYLFFLLCSKICVLCSVFYVCMLSNLKRNLYPLCCQLQTLAKRLPTTTSVKTHDSWSLLLSGYSSHTHTQINTNRTSFSLLLFVVYPCNNEYLWWTVDLNQLLTHRHTSLCKHLGHPFRLANCCYSHANNRWMMQYDS